VKLKALGESNVTIEVSEEV